MKDEIIIYQANEGTTFFLSLNKGVTNESWFSARPGGERKVGVFDSIYETGF
jgi:hypothetical protein